LRRNAQDWGPDSHTEGDDTYNRCVRATWLVGVAACGRVGFDPVAAVDAPDPINIAFATSATFSGDLGGIAGADATCRAAAIAGGLGGEFIAWLSSSSADMIARFAGSRGWQRTDGALVADQIGAALLGFMYTPIDRDELGTRISYGNTAMWSGTGPDGRVTNPTLTCSDWTSIGGSASGGDVSAGGVGFTFDRGNVYSCAASQHLLCFEVSHTVVVAPPTGPLTGRIAFVSRPRASAGLASLDNACNADAAAAALPGTYLAAVATTTSSIAARFMFDGRAVLRPDGSIVATDASGLLGADDLMSFVNQRADGGYIQGATMFTGATDPTSPGTVATTCSDWNDVSIGGMARGGDPDYASRGKFWGCCAMTCADPAGVLCLEQ
jgi:hypothetical protein